VPPSAITNCIGGNVGGGDDLKKRKPIFFSSPGAGEEVNAGGNGNGSDNGANIT
jgi:hypothetical protein